MRLQIERNPAPVWFGALIPLISILLTFLLTSGFVLAYGANPLEAAYYFLMDPLSNPVRLIEVLVKTTPLLLAWLAVPLVIVGGILAGMAWAILPALMKVWLNIDEVVTTLLLNYVAIFLVS